jgi:hypothetical protein
MLGMNLFEEPELPLDDEVRRFLHRDGQFGKGSRFDPRAFAGSQL